MVDIALLLTYFGSTIVFLARVSYWIDLVTKVVGATSTVIWSLVFNSWGSDVFTTTSYLSSDPICSSLVVLSEWSVKLLSTIFAK